MSYRKFIALSKRFSIINRYPEMGSPCLHPILMSNRADILQLTIHKLLKDILILLPLAVFIIMSWGQNKHTKALFTGFSLLLIILCSSSSLCLLVMLDYCLKPISSSLLQAWYIKLNVAWIYYFGCKKYNNNIFFVVS